MIMRFYQEITFIKTPEISPYFIWSKLYSQLHLALVEQQSSDQTVDFGVSFPNYKYESNGDNFYSTLGDKLRIFAKDEDSLQRLNLVQWLNRLADYLHISSIQVVPEQVVNYLAVKRHQGHTNMDRLTRRFSKRQGISLDEAKKIQIERFAKDEKISLKEAEKFYRQPRFEKLPFIKLTSLSNSENFYLRIKQIASDKHIEGPYSTYGLSKESKTTTTASTEWSTVPHW